MSKIGAALRIRQFEGLCDWLSQEERPLELQDFVDIQTLLHDGAGVVSRYDKLLSQFPTVVGMHGPFIGIDLANPDPDMSALVQKRICTAMEFGIQLGIDQMVIHSPFTYWHSLNSRNYKNIWPLLFAAVEKNLTPVLKLACEAGVCVVLENVEDAEPWIRKELVARLANENLAVSLDTGHGFIAQQSFNGDPLLDQVDVLGESLVHVHLNDNDGHADRHWNVGDGCICWAPIFSKFRKMKSHPRLILEIVEDFELIPEMIDGIRKRFGEDL